MVGKGYIEPRILADITCNIWLVERWRAFSRQCCTHILGGGRQVGGSVHLLPIIEHTDGGMTGVGLVSSNHDVRTAHGECKIH